MKVDLNKIDELLQNSNLSEVARAVGIPYRTLQAWKRGENKWWADTQEKLTKLQNHINLEELKMKETNGLELSKLLTEAKNQGADFKVLETSVQGLRGIYVELDKTVSYDDDLFNIALIQEIEG